MMSNTFTVILSDSEEPIRVFPIMLVTACFNNRSFAVAQDDRFYYPG